MSEKEPIEIKIANEIGDYVSDVLRRFPSKNHQKMIKAVFERELERVI